MQFRNRTLEHCVRFVAPTPLARHGQIERIILVFLDWHFSTWKVTQRESQEKKMDPLCVNNCDFFVCETTGQNRRWALQHAQPKHSGHFFSSPHYRRDRRNQNERSEKSKSVQLIVAQQPPLWRSATTDVHYKEEINSHSEHTSNWLHSPSTYLLLAIVFFFFFCYPSIALVRVPHVPSNRNYINWWSNYRIGIRMEWSFHLHRRPDGLHQIKQVKLCVWTFFFFWFALLSSSHISRVLHVEWSMNVVIWPTEENAFTGTPQLISHI